MDCIIIYHEHYQHSRIALCERRCSARTAGKMNTYPTNNKNQGIPTTSAPLLGAASLSSGAGVRAFGASAPSFTACLPTVGACLPAFGEAARGLGTGALAFGKAAPTAGASAPKARKAAKPLNRLNLKAIANYKIKLRMAYGQLSLGHGRQTIAESAMDCGLFTHTSEITILKS